MSTFQQGRLRMLRTRPTVSWHVQQAYATGAWHNDERAGQTGSGSTHGKDDSPTGELPSNNPFVQWNYHGFRSLQKRIETCPKCKQTFATRTLKKQHVETCMGSPEQNDGDNYGDGDVNPSSSFKM